MIKIVHGGLVLFLFFTMVAVCMWGCPRYRLYTAEMGRQSDSIRALGTAAANRIIGESLKNNDKFLSFYFMTQTVKSKNQTIYVPSGNIVLPVPEASRLIQQDEKQPVK